MSLGRPKTGLVLAPSERDVLTRLSRRRKTQAIALRARIVLECAGRSGIGQRRRVSGT